MRIIDPFIGSDQNIISKSLHHDQCSDALVNDYGKILKGEILEILVVMVLAQAETGIEIISSSDMMDGCRVCLWCTR